MNIQKYICGSLELKYTCSQMKFKGGQIFHLKLQVHVQKQCEKK